MTDNLDNEAKEPSEMQSSTPAIIEKFVIRLPKGLRNKIKHLSEKNRRSMNSEIIMVLEKHIQQNLLAYTAENVDFSDEANSQLSEQISREVENSLESFANEQSETFELTDVELTRKLEDLPKEKKAALLELLG